MPPLEIWTNVSGGVMLRDAVTGACRELKDIQFVTFIDGSVFPSPKQDREMDSRMVRTLGGAAVGVKL